MCGFFCFFLLRLHQNTQPEGFLLFSVPSTVQLKPVHTASNAAKLTTSARWGLLNMVEDHFLWCQLQLRCALSIFSSLWLHVCAVFMCVCVHVIALDVTELFGMCGSCLWFMCRLKIICLVLFFSFSLSETLLPAICQSRSLASFETHFPVKSFLCSS